ncbi:hypothetical protein IAT40_001453 [Kwoniella sp. CBS 6097]
MSTLATANLSSDEEDTDFIPQEPKSKFKRKIQSKTKPKRIRNAREGSASASATSSDSDSDSGSSGDEDHDNEKERAAKRLKVEEDEVVERRRRAKEEFERMKAELNAPASASATTSSSAAAAGVGTKTGGEMVEIQRPRHFAGNTIYETVKLRADDPEAIAYLAKQKVYSSSAAAGEERNDSEPAGSISPTVQQSAVGQGKVEGGSNENEYGGSSTSILKPTASTSTSTSAFSAQADAAQRLQFASATTPAPAVKPKPKGPVRRKPRQSLETMSAALDKGKKMTTLEKSQMDWKSHTSTTNGMADELAANRKGGGYLEKRDFLDRVGERRSGAFDDHLNAGRR